MGGKYISGIHQGGVWSWAVNKKQKHTKDFIYQCAKTELKKSVHSLH